MFPPPHCQLVPAGWQLFWIHLGVSAGPPHAVQEKGHTALSTRHNATGDGQGCLAGITLATGALPTSPTWDRSTCLLAS